jgi:hypothetical protein
MVKLRLIGVSKRGKQKIKEHGEEYKFIRLDDVQFAPGKHILVESLKDGQRRWIREKDDPDFIMEG